MNSVNVNKERKNQLPQSIKRKEEMKAKKMT